MAFSVNASIIGIGQVPPRRDDANSSGVEFAATALLDAARDAGLDRQQIDGLVVQHGTPLGPDYDEVSQYLDLRIETGLQMWGHGRFTGSTLLMAASMVQSGAAQHVACVTAYSFDNGEVYRGARSSGWLEELRRGGGPHGELPYVGLTGPIGQAAMSLRTYALNHDLDLLRLYDVVAAARAWAALNPIALRTRQLSFEDYRDDRMVVDPLRRADCNPISQGAWCVIVGRADRAGAGRDVRILGGQALPAGRREFIWGRPGMGMWLQGADLDFRNPDDAVYGACGVRRGDVDLVYTYDTFSHLTWLGLERFGFCGPGQAPDFVRDTGIGPGGGLPVNTNGGMICEGSRAGWGHFLEMVAQLRGEAGPRQIAGASLAQWAPSFGESVILAGPQ